MTGSSDVIEIGLLLPASWAEALADLSRRRRQTIAQLLRGIIDKALLEDQREQS